MIPQLTVDRAKQHIIAFINDRAKELNMSNYRLAKESGVAESTVSRIFSGETKALGLDTMLRLCGALRIRPYFVPAEGDTTEMKFEHLIERPHPKG